MTQGHFEAKKHAYRQTQDGVVISFVVHPNDVSPEIATAALGTRYMVGLAEIGDDGAPSSSSGRTSDFESENRGSTPREGTKPKERRPFDSLPLSQQCAITCNDRNFIEYMTHHFWNTMIENPTPDDAAHLVRDHLGIKSRSELDDNLKARQKWRELNDLYQNWLTDRMYPEEARR